MKIYGILKAMWFFQIESSLSIIQIVDISTEETVEPIPYLIIEHAGNIAIVS